jgi:hypothetical protein
MRVANEIDFCYLIDLAKNRVSYKQRRWVCWGDEKVKELMNAERICVVFPPMPYSIHRKSINIANLLAIAGFSGEIYSINSLDFLASKGGFFCYFVDKKCLHNFSGRIIVQSISEAKFPEVFYSNDRSRGKFIDCSAEKIAPYAIKNLPKQSYFDKYTEKPSAQTKSNLNTANFAQK